MKSDLNDLKSLVFELIQNNDLRVPNVQSLKSLEAPKVDNFDYEPTTKSYPEFNPYTEEDQTQALQPLIITKKEQEKEESYGSVEIIDENLSIEHHERNLIQKALKKHNNRRKDAAKELGISERTLYRKIKQYNL